MTAQSRITTPNATLKDLQDWAEAAGASRDARYELNKIPARLGMQDADLALLPADLGYFESHIAPASYGAVSRARDLAAARQRGNGRVRALLQRFLAETGGTAAPAGREAWDALIAFVAAREGFADRGAAFSTGVSRGLTGWRARSPVAPDALTSQIAEEVSRAAAAGKRKSLHNGLRLLNRLIRDFADAAELTGLLPTQEITVPRPSARARRIVWARLPDAFRASADAAFRRCFGRPEDRVAEARARLARGENPAEVHKWLNETGAQRQRLPKNLASAREGYLRAVLWAVRAAEDLGTDRAALNDLAEVLRFEVLDRAAQDQIARARASDRHKDPGRSQTLHARLTALQTLARHGLGREDLAGNVDLVRQLYPQFVVRPRQMTDEADRICRMLQHYPHLAASFVNGAARIAARTDERLAAARAAGNRVAELSALRLYASAVFWGVQLSRPLRTANLIALRLSSDDTAPGHVTWLKNGKHAELRFAPGEIKNGATVTVHVTGAEARILWRWVGELRARYLQLREIADSPYLLPGASAPRFVKDGLNLPGGCVSPSSFSEVWSLGADVVGIDLTPHRCRHAVATLILAIDPGNFARVASVLGDTEDTVRRHYGRDSGEQAAVAVRAALKAQHPDIFQKLKRRH